MLSLRIPPPIWMLLAGAVMWSLDHFWPVLAVLSAPWNRLGWCLVAVGLVPVLTAMRQFVRAATTISPLSPDKASALVTGGIYRYTRNPMYVGLLLLLIGWAVVLGSLSPWLIPPLFVVVITQLQILPEERALRARFPAAYEDYTRSVGRWLGRGRQ